MPWRPLKSSASRADASASDQKNSPSRLRFRPPCRPTFGFRLRPPGWASIYSRSVLGANWTVEVSRRPFKACPNSAVAICKKFSFQHFPHRARPSVDNFVDKGQSPRPRNASDVSRARITNTASAIGEKVWCYEFASPTRPRCGATSSCPTWQATCREPASQARCAPLGRRHMLRATVQLDITRVTVHRPSRLKCLLLPKLWCFIS